MGGDWSTLPLTLSEARRGSSLWTRGDQLVIMGGDSDAASASETVSSDGAVTSSSFSMKYETRQACSITLTDHVVLTGGEDTLTRVSRYEESGWVRNMGSLNQGRAGHGCTAFFIRGQQVLMVTGGYDDDYNRLDSTELLRPGSDWQVITSARLPRPMEGVRVTTVDNRVLLSGGRDDDGDRSADILEYRDGEGWNKIGTMRDAKYYHATSIIEFKEFEEYCN